VKSHIRSLVKLQTKVMWQLQRIWRRTCRLEKWTVLSHK